MQVTIAQNPAELSRIAADYIEQRIQMKPDLVMTVATGETVMGTYRELASRVNANRLDVSRVRVIQLDAYVGISPVDERSLYRWMMESFVYPLGIPPENVVRLAGDAANPEEACASVERTIEKLGGFDLAILGLGANGHLGFNEPPSGPDSTARLVELTPESVQSNARYWGGLDRVPRQALTLGMATILSAREQLLLVSGTHKATILQWVIDDSPTVEVPASYLKDSAGSQIIADQDAATLLN